MPSSKNFLAIDFGTTNSVMAGCDPETGMPEVIRNASGQEKTPSVTYYGDHDVLVGSAAEEMLSDIHLLQPSERLERESRLVRSVKRDLTEGQLIGVPGRDVAPEEVVADILRQLKQDAEHAHFHEEVSRVVLTHPVSFDAVQRKMLERAAGVAGFSDVRLLAEPEAAALAYAHAGRDVGRTVLVYDLGGGTFDLALVQRGADGQYHLAMEHDGDPRCGGDDMDRALYDYWESRVRSTLERGIGEDTHDIDLVFLAECRKRKEQLSGSVKECEFRCLLRGGDIAHLSLGRGEFHELIRSQIAATVDRTRQMLEEARKRKLDVETVVLIGGASQTPLVREMLEEVLPVPPRSWQLRHLAVALGAARQGHAWWNGAATSNGRHAAISSRVASDRKEPCADPSTVVGGDPDGIVTERAVAEASEHAGESGESLLQCLARHAEQKSLGNGKYFVGPAIPPFVVQGMLKTFRGIPRRPEDVLFIMDRSVVSNAMGMGAVGLIVFRDGLGWRQDFLSTGVLFSFEQADAAWFARKLTSSPAERLFLATAPEIRSRMPGEALPVRYERAIRAMWEILERGRQEVNQLTCTASAEEGRGS